MNVLKLRDIISVYKKEKQAFINDTYMWVEVARKSISNISEEDGDFNVPGTNGKTKTIKRKDINSLKNRINNVDIYNSAYVILISNIEDYFNKIMRVLLNYDNNRIKYTIQDVSMETRIDIIDFIDKSKDEMINKIIEKRINSIFYASPKKQLEYFEKALGIHIDDDTWYKWIEYKARRDIIIHNNSIINEVYFGKVNGYGKYRMGETITFDEEEFKNIIVFFKSIIGKVDKVIREEYHIPSRNEAAEFISRKELKMLENL